VVSVVAAKPEELVREGERIERLLEEVHATAGPPTWMKVEELVRRLVALYGAGLGRLLELVADTRTVDDRLRERVAGDELVSSLLLLHGLHPLTTETRVRRALDEVRPYLHSHGGEVELVAVGDTQVELRLLGSCEGCPSSLVTIELALRRVLEEAAPEVTRIHVEGAAPRPAPARDTGLIQIDLTRSHTRTRWTPLPELALAPGEQSAIDVGGVAVLLLRVDKELFAYRDRCTGCGDGLYGATVVSGVLACAGCGLRYDLARAGRAVGAADPHLEALPLLVDAAGARIAVPEPRP
jgi:Fe-S cluster biogenesis protein NfuA/nitrite reductase/ring-hydroxylating ferredoxin subunit